MMKGFFKSTIRRKAAAPGPDVRHILDEIPGAIHGYSLYQMRAVQDFCIRANHPGSGVSWDIGFKNGYVDTDQLQSLAALGSGDIFLETLYDQSGNGNHLTCSGSGGRRMTINPNTGLCSFTGVQGANGAYSYLMTDLNGVLDSYHVATPTDLDGYSGYYPITQKGFFGWVTNTNFMVGIASEAVDSNNRALVGTLRANNASNRRQNTPIWRPKEYYLNRKFHFNLEFNNPLLTFNNWHDGVSETMPDFNYPFTELNIALGYGGTGGSHTTPYNQHGPFYFHAMWKTVLSPSQKATIKQYLEETYNL